MASHPNGPHNGPDHCLPGALGHIRVLDLSRVLAGPWCSQNLADLGADVIKIERPGAGDDTRAWGPPYAPDAAGHPTTEAAYYLSANRGKRSLTVDIASGQGQALLRDLVRHCDAVPETFKVGQRLKLRLTEANPVSGALRFELPEGSYSRGPGDRRDRTRRPPLGKRGRPANIRHQGRKRR